MKQRKRRGRVRAIRDDVLLDEPLDPTGPLDPRRVAPAWGWRRPGGGRASHVGTSPEYQGTTSQVCGLYPFVAGSGAPHIGVPIGRHMHWGQVVSLEPFSWLASGLVTNPGIFVLGQPGVGKALALDTPVPTPTGWSTMGELMPGDVVFDETGTPTEVVAVTGVMHDRPCFEVELSDGSVFLADAEHLWVTETSRVRRNAAVARVRPAARRVVGTDEEIAAAERLRDEADPDEPVTLTQLAERLGWTDARLHRLYRWAAALSPLDAPGRGAARAYRTDDLITMVLNRLRGATHDQRAKQKGPAAVTTREIAATLMDGDRRNHAIRTTRPLRLDDVELLVEPRALGLWLGDGTAGSGGYTTADPELADVFREAGFDVEHIEGYHYRVKAPGRRRKQMRSYRCEHCDGETAAFYEHRRYCSRKCAALALAGGASPAPIRACMDCGEDLARSSVSRRCGGCGRRASLAGRLRELGVLHDKHIPSVYLRASESQRRALLAGLLDSDGTVGPGGQVQFTSCNERLARDTFELVAGLGYRPTVTSKMARLDGRDIRTAWTVGFTTADPVFGLARKAHSQRERARGNGNHTAYRYVVRADPVESRPVRCIQVAASSGMFLVGRAMVPTHNSSIGKRLMTGMCAYGIHPIVLGDVKPDYARLVSKLGGQVIRVGRGLDRINPLDSGPLGQAIRRLHDAGHDDVTRHLLSELRGRRLALLAALCALGRGHQPVTPGEEVMLGAAIDHLVETLPAGTDPTIHDVLDVIRDEPEKLAHTAEVDSVDEFKQDSKFLRQTLRLLVDGSLRGMFDGPTSQPIDLDAPAIDVDLSAVANGGEDTAVAASMLCTWAYGFGVVDASLALSEVGLAPARNYIAFMDELWRALRGAPGLVDRADTLTRVNRQKGMAQIMMTHSLADLDALPTEEDRAKAKGFVERCSVTILGGLPPRELDAVAEVVGQLSVEERRMVSSWSTPTSWTGGEAHPGRGKYLIKAGMRSGIPVEMEYVADEADLYDTDAAAVATVGLHALRTRNVYPAEEIPRVAVELSGETGSLSDLVPDETDIGVLDIDVANPMAEAPPEPPTPEPARELFQFESATPPAPPPPPPPAPPADPRAPVRLNKRPLPRPAPFGRSGPPEPVPVPRPAEPPTPAAGPAEPPTGTIDLDEDPYGPSPVAAVPPMDTGPSSGNDGATGPEGDRSFGPRDGTSGDERSDPNREAVR